MRNAGTNHAVAAVTLLRTQTIFGSELIAATAAAGASALKNTSVGP
jgi:hypothetical protein